MQESSNAPCSLNRRRIVFAFVIFASVFFLTAKDLGDYGVTWDEVYPNFDASLRQADWFRQIFSLEHPFSKETIDQYWKTTSDHPSLNRSLSALSYLMFHRWLGTIVSLRLPSALWFAAMAAAIFLWMQRAYSLRVGLGSVVALILMPHLFAHGHLSSLDLAVTALWVLTTCVYVRGLDSWRWGWLTGLVYGLALSVKLHAFFFPIPLILWTVLQRRREWYRPLIPMMTLSPSMYLILQPWLWHDLVQRLAVRFFHYADKSVASPIRLYYFGTLYSNDTPWHYAFVMFLISVPTITLLIFFIGVHRSLKREKEEAMGTLILLSFIVPISLLLLPRAQGYDGTRLFIECFPFAACLAGLGWERVIETIRHRFGGCGRRCRLLGCGAAVLWIVPIAIQMIAIHPFQLSYYSEWIGSLPGAHRIGMESTYWCDAITPKFLERVNQALPLQASIAPMSMSSELLPFYQKQGLLRSDLKILEREDHPDYFIMQCRQGMFARAEWYFYATRKPLLQESAFGVPLAILFKVKE